MKHLIIGIIAFAAYILGSCNKNHTETIHPLDISNHSVIDSIETIIEFNDKYPVSLAAKDSLLYVICVKSDTCLHVVNLNTKKLMTSLGTVGHGPNDLINPNFILSLNHSDILLDVGNLHKIIRIKNNAGQIELSADIPYPEPIFLSSELNMSANYIVGRKVDSAEESMFFIYNKNTKQLIKSDYYPSLSTPVKDKNYVYAPVLAANETKNRIIVGMYFFDLLHIYDFSGNQIQTCSFSEKYTPRIDKKAGFIHLEDGYSGITRAYPTEKYCYLLRSEKDENGISSDMLIQIDWDGNLIHSYKFEDHVSGQFYVNEDSNTLYIIRNYMRSDDEDIFAIVSYSLTDIPAI